MMKFRLTLTWLAALVVTLTACQHDAPSSGVKPVEERTILALDDDGNIYNIHGNLVKTLPDCDVATQIITDGDDYFVSGIHSKSKVGYWKNGKWNTLHVDFIDDVDHWIFGIAKWDYNIYLLDYPCVLRNSGIFRLEDAENFSPAKDGLSVSEGNCFVVGLVGEPGEDYPTTIRPVIYKEVKGVYKRFDMPLPEGAQQGSCNAICAYDRVHYVAGGVTQGQATMWEDDKVYTLPGVARHDTPPGPYNMITNVEMVARGGGHIYAAGVEYVNDMSTSILWTDGVPRKLAYNTTDTDIESQALDLVTYGNDVYVLTTESPHVAVGDQHVPTTSVIWLNGDVLAVLPFAVNSIAVY